VTNDPGTQRGVTPLAPLRPYVADLHAQWLREEPDERYRRLAGTLVFADISGFTPLTERLARRGRVGAEALTDVLNDVFGALLAVASAHGGDLLKFGGDALLLLFDGLGQQRRACAAAAAMQTALRPWRRFSTEAGSMSLRMSVGVATGDVHAFLVGDLHRELLIGGPVVSRVVALESVADAGEIVVDDAVARRLEDADLGAVKGAGRLLRRGPVVELPAPRACTVGDVTLGIPVALRDHLTRRIDEGEHRQAVLTFVQFKGLDALLSGAGPDAATSALDELVRRIQRACAAHGVCFLATDLDGDGGKVLLAAGAPTASADDPDRTLVTLLDVLAEPSPLAVRAGVNAGAAFAVDMGSPSRRTYAVMGDATNLAARVMGRAAPGQIVATAAVLERTRAPFDHEPMEPFLVKGKSVPINASRVLGARAGQDTRSAPDAAVHLVGRAHERALIAKLIADARDGRGGVLALVGEAGIGKSALVDHARTFADGMPQLSFAAAPYAAASPYYAVRGPLRNLLGLPAGADADALTAVLASAAPELVPWAPLVGVVLGISAPETDQTRALAPEFRRARAHAAVQTLLARLLHGASAVLVEDAHWLDEASGALLADVAAAATEQGWAMLVTRQPAGGTVLAPDNATVVTLGPLAAAELQDLTASALGEVPAHVRAQLVERSGGNPLFLLELLTAARNGTDAESLPDTIEALVAARVDALQPVERSLVRHAAVFGHRFTTAQLAALTGTAQDAVDRALAPLDAVVVPERNGYRFVHALVRDAAYAALPYRQRRVLHQRAGELIEHQGRTDLAEWSDLLSLHFEQARDHAKTWRYAAIAAARARVQWAPADACTLYRRALGAARALGVADTELASTYEELGDCAELAGRYVEAADAYREARARVGEDPVRAAELCRKEGWVRERSGRYSAALRWYRRGLDALGDADDEALIRTQLVLAEGAARLRQGRYRQAVPLLHAAVQGAQRHQDEATLAHAYYLLDWAYTDLGSDEALHYRELSLPIYQRLGNLAREGVVVSNLGIDAYFEGRWADAVELYERGRVASTRAGDVVQAATAANNIGEVYSDQGRLDAAETMFRDALATWQRAPFPVGIWLATSNLGRVAARGGRFAEAAELFAKAREGFGVIGADGYVVETRSREVELHALAGEPAAADALAVETLERVRRLGGLGHLTVMLLRLRGYAAAQRGDHALAARLLQESLAAAGDSGLLFERALTLEALGRVLDGAEGEAHRGAATDLLQRLDVVRTPHFPLPTTEKVIEV
jgi:class 3 adenylate cyclase/predicted ATPase